MKINSFTVDKNKGIFVSDGRGYGKALGFAILDDVLEYGKEDTVSVFADLNADVANLLALLELTEQELKKLATKKKLYIAPYSLTYIPGKWFSIDKGFGAGHPWIGFSDMSQYDDSYCAEPFSHNKAVLARNTGQLVYEAFRQLGFEPKNLISPANVFRKEGIAKLDLPSYDDVPVDALEVAYECCKGNWVEAFQLGHWDKVWDYDLNSAYPFQASKLLDLRLGRWEQSSDYHPDATYGYARCEVFINSDFSPIIWQNGDRNYTPKQVFTTSLTKNQIDFINTKLGYATVLDGWWWYANKRAVYRVYMPLRKVVADLYKQKQKATGLKRDIIKRIMAGSFYGLFIETRGDDFGDYFLSPWAAEIEVNTQLEIANVVINNGLENNLLHIAVDGITLDCPCPELPQSLEAGAWRKSYEGKALIASSGLVCIDGKQGEGDFSVGYDWLTSQIRSAPKATQYEVEREGVVTLGMAYQGDRFAELGNKEKVIRAVNYGDMKRHYSKMPRNWGDLLKNTYQSVPYPFELLKTLEGLNENK